MKVKILKTGKVEEYEAGYAARLIEQGKAVPAPRQTKPSTSRDTEAQAESTQEERKGRKK